MFYDACRRVLGRLLHPRSRVLLIVVVVVIVAVVLLLVTAVCKRACDRLSYAMLVTSSRRTLRYLVRERKKERARAHAHVHARSPYRASSFLNAFERHRDTDILRFYRPGNGISSRFVETPSNLRQPSPGLLVVSLSSFPPVVGKRSGEHSGHPVYVHTKSAQPAGRPANVRALARANQCAAECVAYACAPVKHNTFLTATDFFPPSPAVERVRLGDVGTPRVLDGAVCKTVQQQVTSTSVGNAGGRAIRSAGPPTPVFDRLARLSACLFARPSARGVISRCSRGFFVSAMHPFGRDCENQ